MDFCLIPLCVIEPGCSRDQCNVARIPTLPREQEASFECCAEPYNRIARQLSIFQLDCQPDDGAGPIDSTKEEGA